MEEQWARFTSITRKLTRLRNAVFPSRTDPNAALAQSPSPVTPAETTYIPVSIPDAISKLCEPTGDEMLDEVHVVLIDLLQHGFIYAVCTPDDPTLRYSATPAGKQYVREHVERAVEDLLGRIWDD